MGTDSKDTGLPLLWNRRFVSTGWTGGQYSLYRVVLAAALVALVWTPMPTTELSGVLPFSGQLTMSDPLRISLTAIGICIGAGFFDRWFAAAALVAAFCLGRGTVWWLLQPLLFAHVLTPPAPFGSLLAVRRPDPGGGWERSDDNVAIAMLSIASTLTVVALSSIFYSLYSGWPTMGDTIARMRWDWREDWFLWPFFLGWILLASKIAAVRRATWLCWIGYVAIAVLPPVLFHAWPLAWLLVVVAVALGAFDPALVPPRRASEPEVVYYDGDCGLCHRTVRFLLAEDREGAAFRYAALQSEHFAEHVGAAEREGLGDSVIVRTAHGRLLQRSSAAVHLLLALGGLWRLGGALLWCVPRPLRDLGYDGVARVRKRVFPAPEGLCPLIRPELQARFLP